MTGRENPNRSVCTDCRFGSHGRCGDSCSCSVCVIARIEARKRIVINKRQGETSAS